MTIGNISFLHIDNHRIVSTILMEANLQTSIFTCLRHNIDGERLCREGDGVVDGGHRGHELVAIGTFVIDIHHLAVREVRVGDGNRHRLTGLGLPLGSAVVDGDVVCSEHLFAVRGSALHRHSIHLRRCGHLPGDRKLHLAAIGGEHLRALHRRSMVSHAAGHRVVAVVLCPYGGLESYQQHKHKAERTCKMLSHLHRPATWFHLGFRALIYRCRFSHNVLIFIFNFNYLSISHSTRPDSSSPSSLTFRPHKEKPPQNRIYTQY